MNDKKYIFKFREAGFYENAYYYYICKIEDKYHFIIKNPMLDMTVLNPMTGEYVGEIGKTQECYDSFILEFKEIVKDWKEDYHNNDILGGTQWELEDKINKIDISGSNEFPKNYNELINLIKKYFY